MSERLEKLGDFLRQNGIAVAAALVILALLSLAVRWVAHSREAPVQKKVLQITGVILKPEPPAQKPPPPPPPPKEQPKETPKEDEPKESTRLVEVRATDIQPPDAAKPQGEPPAGPLALQTEATGEGDAFNLVGNPGGRSVLAPGKIGEAGGAGEGVGVGGGEGGNDGNRYGYYFGRIASQIQAAFQRMKKTASAEARVEIKVWVDASGKVSRVQLLRSTGDEELDRAIESVKGLALHEALPPDLPNPSIYRFVARRPR